jgi:hypothetical protein
MLRPQSRAKVNFKLVAINKAQAFKDMICKRKRETVMQGKAVGLGNEEEKASKGNYINI